MKTTLLSILCIAGFTTLSFGQIEMSIGASGDISGTQIDYTTAGANVHLDINVVNKSGVTKALTIKRVRTNTTPGWSDFLCWGPIGDPLNGICYTASTMSTNPWTTPTAVSIPADSIGFLNIYVDSIENNGCTVFRYSVMEGATELSYLDISVCKSADVNELSPLSITVAPNPANSYFNVKANGIEGSTIQIVDVLGNIVLKETMIGSSKTINTESFRNGVYFVRVEAESQRPATRKIIVRH